ncbi:Response regulators consisting of a CheY-like receiver domain and a winged-helix DNA-binding domain [Rubrobacter radiotolerans]|uniref:Probable transcriptional regulator ycf27 n=1 Tax=Rubrobacter radiotolerans TaxID=42256 RepID=A0A023X1J9_RUBRA|nr:response regulator transcription factor [Rubrobacter radiotolerans]AHY45939.1 Response regulators consisting of a CheY-like receiver domain and a winged-helix DNA-binding domain [Rubrobacter radiotolerans]MDX5893353.1 response regulator transcription factor [Rubrobacter radiotolerans]SMC03555.1 two-component system, OmpR family, alkaline phosphatase synthesis response regulator PhoP [Rubrobacter radiotolerans DSM 5868]
MEETILLVDDDAALLEVTSIVLSSEGYRVVTAEDGVEALKVLGRDNFDLVVLDVMMPKMSGFEVLKEIREKSDVPVVLLTAKSQSVDKVVGLELGADDYITKPFDTKELLARIKAILRRFGRREGESQAGVVRLGGLELDQNGYTVSRDGEAVDLTPTEFRILALLMNRPGQAFTRAQISEAVSTSSHYLASRYIDVHISRLRGKVERDPSKPEIIQTVPSVGYRAARPKK